LFRRERLLLVKIPRRRRCPHLASGRESLHLPHPDEPPNPLADLSPPTESRRRRRQPALSTRRSALVHPGCRPCARGGRGNPGDGSVAAIQARSRCIGGL